MGYLVLGMAILVLDIMTKLIAELQLKIVGTVPLWKDVFHLTYVENPGIAFGMFSNARLFFILVSVMVLILLAIVYSNTTHRTKWFKIATALIYGGAFGNLLERIAKGYVVDFFDFRLIHFPVFNIADIAVCVGACLMIIHFFVSEKSASQESAIKGKDESHV